MQQLFNFRKIDEIRAKPFRFGPNLFDSIRVLGQVDRKFIATIGQDIRIGDDKNESCQQNVLVLFDQHAVHERMRLENLIKGMFVKISNSN